MRRASYLRIFRKKVWYIRLGILLHAMKLMGENARLVFLRLGEQKVHVTIFRGENSC